MNASSLAIDVLLGLTVLACWIGVLGMMRMRHPMQALNYLALPATAGMAALTVAVFLKTGWDPAAFKTVVIAVVVLGINSVVTHASARAFRARELGHWEPRDGDRLEFVPSTHHPGEPRAEMRP